LAVPAKKDTPTTPNNKQFFIAVPKKLLSQKRETRHFNTNIDTLFFLAQTKILFESDGYLHCVAFIFFFYTLHLFS